MKGMARNRSLVGLAALCTVTLCAPAVAKRPVKPPKPQATSQVVPPNANVEGRNYAEWSAAWWQWVMSIPTTQDDTGNSMNPMWDTTGAYALVGQSGKVIFLLGTQGGAVVRNVTIPEGRYIFFPIINFLDDNWNWPDFRGEELAPDALAEELASWVAVTNLDKLYVTVDGVDVPEKELMRGLVISPIFQYWVPPKDNIYGIGYDWPGISPAGWICPAISGGWWVMLKPLPVGTHSLKWGGGVLESPWGAFTQANEYSITVVESCVPKP